MEIEYIDSTHTYLVDGVITPSVTQIIHSLFSCAYENVPKSVLLAKADFGTHVHEAIEKGSSQGLKPLEYICYEEWLKLKQKHNIDPVEHEVIIAYEDLYAGRLDMIADVNYTRCLLDIKTTAKVETEMLEWQLGMYKLAYEEIYHQPLGECYCIWLPKKGMGKLIKINPKKKDEIVRKVKELNEIQSSQYSEGDFAISEN